MSHPLLDLSPDRRADALIDGALLANEAIRLREAAGPLLARLPEDAQVFGEMVVEELARISARLEALSQLQAADALSRAERLRIDPLPHIPEHRRLAAAGPAAVPETDPVLADVGAADFVGHGWYAAESVAGDSLRWSGAARCSTVQLPALGGGPVRVTLSFRAPFGVKLDLAGQDLFLDGVPLALETLSNDGIAGLFTAPATLPDLPAGSRVSLLLHGVPFTDPARRDGRTLGLGLGWVRIERAA